MSMADRVALDGTTTDAAANPESASARTGRFAWMRHWEFWLALALAAVLRLWRVDLTQFLDDQAGIAGIARAGLQHGALPLTSNLSSIGTFHSPLTEYLLMPFLAFGGNPLPAVISIALWNVVGVACCYIFALRYFGRRAALAAALLFASCGTAINYSRFIWQPNYLPPILGLWALVLFGAVVRGARGWLVPAAVLTVLAMLFHETAAILLVVLAAALLLAPHRPRRREWLVSCALGVLLFLPLLVFEVVSRGYDLRALAHYVKAHGHVNLEVLRALEGALGGMGSGDLGPQAPLYAFRGVYPILDALALLFFAAGYLLLTAHVVMPARAAAQSVEIAPGATRRERVLAWIGTVWNALRADARWRGNLLLWLWVTVPLLAMLRHSSAVTVHYLLPLYPALFVVAGLPFQWLTEHGAAPVRRLPAHWWRAAPLAGLALLALLVACQSARWLLYPGSLASGQFTAYTFYGYPLSELQSANTTLGGLQEREHATSVVVMTPTNPRYRAPMDYLLVDGSTSRVTIAEGCLLLPPPSAGPALVIATDPSTVAARFLATLPNAERVAQVPLAGGPAFGVYRVASQTPPLADELPVLPASFAAGGSGLRLDAAAVAAPGLVRLRWRVLGSETSSAEQPWYRVAASQGTASGRVDCQPTRWQAGETLFTWVPIAAPATIARVSGRVQASIGPVTIHVFAGTLGPDMPALGPLHFITGRPGGSPLVPLPRLLPSGGTSSPGDGYVLPITG